MNNTSISRFFSRKDSKLVKRYNLKNQYDDQLQLVDTASEFKIINRLDFHGHGDLISTTHDLLKYDLALSNAALLNNTTLKEAFTPVKLSNGKDNIQHYALGWISNDDQSKGEIVKHDGGLPGGRSVLLRNLSKHQTIIIYDNTANNVIPIADNALSILNGETVAKPKKSASYTYGIALAKNGSIAADKVMDRLTKDTLNYYLSEDELNSLGYAFIAGNRDIDAEAAFKKNTELFPSSWNVFDSYGEALLKNGKKDQAVKMYQKSLKLNPANENARKVLEQLVR